MLFNLSVTLSTKKAKKKRMQMDYGKFSRALRYGYTDQTVEKIKGITYGYRFL